MVTVLQLLNNTLFNFILLYIWQATKEFLEEIGLRYSDPDNEPLSWATAVKFLMARKFDVHRAVELFMSHEVCIVFTVTYCNCVYVNDDQSFI